MRKAKMEKKRRQRRTRQRAEGIRLAPFNLLSAVVMQSSCLQSLGRPLHFLCVRVMAIEDSRGAFCFATLFKLCVAGSGCLGRASISLKQPKNLYIMGYMV